MAPSDASAPYLTLFGMLMELAWTSERYSSMSLGYVAKRLMPPAVLGSIIVAAPKDGDPIGFATIGMFSEQDHIRLLSSPNYVPAPDAWLGGPKCWVMDVVVTKEGLGFQLIRQLRNKMQGKTDRLYGYRDRGNGHAHLVSVAVPTPRLRPEEQDHGFHLWRR